MTRSLLCALLLTCTLHRPALAQPPQAAAVAVEKMAPLAPLVGVWKGEGWMILPGGKRSEFLSSEAVQSELGGVVLLVHGQHYDKAQPDRLVHDALATIAWDGRGQGYRFRSHVATGMMGDFPLVTDGKSFTWTLDMPGGTMRYVTRYTDNVWHEIGERSGDGGKSWTRFFEMTLKRQ